MMNDTPTPSKIPVDVQKRLDDLQTLRDRGDRELNFRRLSGRRHHPDLKDMTDLELNQATIWYRRKIDEILRPYET